MKTKMLKLQSERSLMRVEMVSPDTGNTNVETYSIADWKERARMYSFIRDLSKQHPHLTFLVWEKME